MKNVSKISPAVIKRLPRYRRFLTDLQKKSVERVSSGKLSELMGYTASQIRQDLNNFGGFGQQGYGYNVKALGEEIDGILGLGSHYRIIIVGVGNLGRAVANYTYFYKSEFEIKAMFDIAPSVIGTEINGITVLDADALPAYLGDHDTDIGIITTNRGSAQHVADIMVAGGVRGIWNFAPTDLKVPESIALQAVHLSDSLHELVYYINNPGDPCDPE
ncbi:MAG: redox-sensing transcriptional repressor Rex [Clostridiales Family XIII bacterium]|jgi:redox-sensing transcriptional repressor|nr:redox-sensing transcriptional repressor Rex [Clostridiales Family XIII bacterium]